MMNHINSKEYWETRFKSGNWNKSGKNQTKEYARANVSQMKISPDFDGTILDFGCALGDSLPVYSIAFPKAKLFGIDISDYAISICKKRFGSIADFSSTDIKNIAKKDIIIASHVMEHITNDKYIVEDILLKCEELFLFVPYKENPLYHEHVNYYTENYYDNFNVIEKKIFKVSYRVLLPLKSIAKNLFLLRFNIHSIFSKEIIMFRFKGGTHHIENFGNKLMT